MSERLTLADFDQDGALQETAEAALGESRADFLRKAVIGGGALLGGGAFLGGMPEIASGQSPPRSDVNILNFALTLEFLEAEFYKEAVRNRALRGPTAVFARAVRNHEVAHVNFLRNALGRAAVKKPRFDFKGTTRSQRAFQRTALTLEDTGVKAYLGQVGNIKSKRVLAAAGSILPIEARHTAWIANIIAPRSRRPAPTGFEGARTRAQILAAVRGTGFIVG